MADNKGNIKEEWVVKLSADTYEFDNSMEKADDTLDEQKSNVKKLQKAYQSLYNWVRNTNRQFKNTGKKLGVNLKSFGNPYERYSSKNKISKTNKPTIDDTPVEKFTKSVKDKLENVSDMSKSVAKNMENDFKSVKYDHTKSENKNANNLDIGAKDISKDLVKANKTAFSLRDALKKLTFARVYYSRCRRLCRRYEIIQKEEN